MQPGDWRLLYFIKSPEDYIFRDWWPHVTVLGWFRTQVSQEKLVQSFQSAWLGIKPFQPVVGAETRLSDGTVLANLIHTPSPFEQLSLSAYKTLEAVDGEIVSRLQCWLNYDYLPHITVHKLGRATKGYHLNVDRIYLTQLIENDDKQYPLNDIKAEILLNA